MPQDPESLHFDLENLPTLDEESLDRSELELIQTWADQSPEIQRHIDDHGIESLGMLVRRRLASIANKVTTVEARNPGLHRVMAEEMFDAEKYGRPVIPAPDRSYIADRAAFVAASEHCPAEQQGCDRRPGRTLPAVPQLRATVRETARCRIEAIVPVSKRGVTMRRCLSVLVLCGLAGCGDDGPLRSPTAPTAVTTTTTTTTTTVTSTWPTKPADPRFNDAFWRELVFAQYEYTGFDYRVINGWAEPATVPVYLRTTGAPASAQTMIRTRLSEWLSALLGEPWRGSFETGTTWGPRPAWINIQFMPSNWRPGWCGGDASTTSWHSGHPQRGESTISEIRISTTAGCSSRLAGVMQHELGHAFGFMHVGDPSALMNNRRTLGPATFNARERYHMQLALEVGPGQPYCGWPYSSGCEQP